MSRIHFVKLGTLTGALALSMSWGVSSAMGQTVLTVTHSSPADSHFSAKRPSRSSRALKRKPRVLSTSSFSVWTMSARRWRASSSAPRSVGLCHRIGGPLGNFVPETRVLDVPFLFEGYEHARGAGW